MAAKRGRKNKYETEVVPFFDKITEWLANGATERQVAQNLGIAYSTFNWYKTQYPELTELIKKARQSVILQLRGALIKRALGYKYTETKEVTEKMDFPPHVRKQFLELGITPEQLDAVDMVKTEICHKYMPPDVAALNLALKNYDKENWANDPQMIEIRKKELELKERQIQNNEW